MTCCNVGYFIELGVCHSADELACLDEVHIHVGEYCALARLNCALRT